MRIFTSTVADGNMDFRFGGRKEVEGNRKMFFETCGFVYADAVVMEVEHGDHIKNIVENRKYTNGARTEVCEALVTNQKNVPLMLLTADCYPCVLYDRNNECVALLHLGWKPTGLRLVEKVLRHMQEKYGSVAKNIEAHFGPGISKESYVAENPSQKNEPAWQPYLFAARSGGGMHVDILGFATAQCLENHVTEEQMYVSGIDTYSSDKYFSHYRATRVGGVNGRFATTVIL